MSVASLLYDRDLILAAISLIVALTLLWLYMRAVKRSAIRPAGSAEAAEATGEPGPPALSAPPVAPLVITESPLPSATSAWAAWAGPIRAALVQLVAGLVYAAGLTLAWMWLASKAAGTQWLVWPVLGMFTLFFAWPLVIVIGLTATVTWRARLLVVLAYVAMLVPAAFYLMQGTPITLDQFARNWWSINGPATVFVLVLLARPIRAFGPVVAALVVAAAAGVFGLAGALDARHLERVAALATSLGLAGAAGGYIAAFVLFGAAALAAGMVGYAVLRGLGQLYRARWVSDQSIQTDAIWLTFAVLQAPKELPFGGLAAFLLYKLVAALAQMWASPGGGEAASAPRLLLLRVFSLGARSGHLFDGFARLWRYTGSVRMIAGPDLAHATVELHEFLDFLAGRLQRRFITGPRVLEQRLAETTPRRDRDGRYRVSGFFCHTDTWQAVMRRLARDSDVVMMDLRGFTRQAEGCIFELNELLDQVSLPRVLLIVDATTDEPFLAATLQQAWARIGPHSPNRGDPAPRVQLYRLARADERSIGRLAARMAELAAPAGP